MSAPRPGPSPILLFLAAVCALSVIAGEPFAAGKPPETPVIVALPGRLEPFAPYRDPVLSSNVPWSWLIGRGLMRLDHKGRLRGDLAARAATPDGGYTWDFTLRPGTTLSDGTALTPELFCETWRSHLRNQDGTGWLFREVESGPMAVGSHTVRFKLTVARPWFPWRLTHPWTTVVEDPRDAGAVWTTGTYRVDSPAWPSGPDASPRPTFQPELRLEPTAPGDTTFLLVQTAAGGRALATGGGDAAAARLQETELSGPLAGHLACAPGATRYALLFQSTGVGDPDPAFRRRLVAAIDRPRLSRRAAPTTGSVWRGPSPPDRSSSAAQTEAAPLGGVQIALLVDGEDPVALAIADQMQAELLDQGVDLRVEPAPGLAYDRRLREGHYGMALAGFRPIFGEAGLDLAARIRAAGFRTRDVEDGLSAMLTQRRRSLRRREAERVESLLRERLMLAPLIEIDECWTHETGVDMRRTLAPLTSVPARRFTTRRSRGGE